jgi:serine/threonine-protein kinase SRPK3
MFDGRVPDGSYQVKEHLAEMVDLFGPFAKSLLGKGDQELVQKLFDEDGKIKDAPPMNRPGLASDAFTPGLDEEIRTHFVSFLYAMMKLNPEERLSTEDLLRHPYLGAMK